MEKLNNQLDKKHFALDAELKEFSKNLFERDDLKKTIVVADIAVKLNVSPNTINNYCNGMGSDGFLKEAILSQLKKY